MKKTSKKINKLMNKYFKGCTQYLNMLFEVFCGLSYEWSKSDTEKKISLLDENNEGLPFLFDYYSDDPIYPQRIEIKHVDDGHTGVFLYAKYEDSDEEFILDAKEWIMNVDLLPILIEEISIHLGYDLDKMSNLQLELDEMQ